jgi:hypothetical protein
MPSPKREPLLPGRDYVVEDGLWVLTREFLLRRGYCCKSGCRNCPYGFRKPAPDADTTDSTDTPGPSGGGVG